MRLSLSVAVAMFATTVAHADLRISAKPTHDVECVAGVCTATAKSANLNAGELVDMLASGDATVNTGGGAVDIVVRDGFSWTSTSRLMLDAARSIEIRKPIVVVGKGAVTIAYNDGSSNGDLLFTGKGKLGFKNMNSKLSINGTDYTLVRDIAGLASAIEIHPASAYAFAADHNARKDGTYSHSPVRSTFTGIFEGLGHTISNLTITTSDDLAGFFSLMDGTIRDFTLRAASLTATHSSDIGLLAGLAHIATHVAADGTINASANSPVAGGLIGNASQGTVNDCSANVYITSDRDLTYGGGLVGLSSGVILAFRTPVAMSYPARLTPRPS